MRAWLLYCVCAATAVQVTVRVSLGDPAAQTNINQLTSVTIDVCALKQGLGFEDPLFRALTRNLAPTVLRIGGSDQNIFSYDMSPDAPPMGKCSCFAKCVMTADYWDTVLAFANATGVGLIFGLNPANASNACSLVEYTARVNFSMLAYSYGNEQIGDQTLATQYLERMKQVRAAIQKSHAGRADLSTPMLIGADTGIGPRRGTTPQTISKDAGINQHLDWVRLFARTCSSVLDALSWHTYDYRSEELGGTDHQPLPYPTPPSASKLWDPQYHDVAARLLHNISSIVSEESPALKDKIWLTETNSICHQGVWNATNAYVNSLWLVDRLGLMATNGVQLMARQSLIGYNYSLLGNYPSEPLTTSPDFYTTVLFRRLFGDVVLSVDSSVGTLRSYGFCSREFPGGIALALVNLDQYQDASVSTALEGRWESYLLEPEWTGESTAPVQDRVTSRKMVLNGGAALEVGPNGALPQLNPIRHPSSKMPVLMVPKLSILFVVFPEQRTAACQ